MRWSVSLLIVCGDPQKLVGQKGQAPFSALPAGQIDADYALSSNGMSGRVLMCKISCSVRLGEGFV
jgi:hypothetical protein